VHELVVGNGQLDDPPGHFLRTDRAGDLAGGNKRSGDGRIEVRVGRGSRPRAPGLLLAPCVLAQGGMGVPSTGKPRRKQWQQSGKRALDVADHGKLGG